MRKAKLIVRMSLIATVAVLVSACASTGSNYSIGPSVDPASTIQINASFDIPVNKARVFLQNGLQIAEGEIDRWITYCSVLVQNVQYGNQPQQTILPGRFSIVKIRQSNDFEYATRIYVASRRLTYDPPSFLIHQVDMRLQSVEQPNVRSLICAKRVDHHGHHFPTLAEIRGALGNLIEIETPL